MNTKSLLTITLVLNFCFIFSQTKPEKNREFYFSWGYNTEWYTRSNININQPSLGSNFTFVNIVAHDHKGWDDHLLQKQLTIPQYNYRLGWFFNKKYDWGFEINFDHTKYVVDQGQKVEVKGKYHGRSIDTMLVTSPQTLLWQLNNGANFLEFNLVKRIKLINICNGNVRLDGLLKAGFGPNIPHVQNTIFGNDNNPHFQLGGWNADFDAAVRLTFFKYIFFELYDKAVYARYWDLRLYQGTGKQSFACYELALVVGGTFRY